MRLTIFFAGIILVYRIGFASPTYHPDESLIREFDQRSYDQHSYQPFPRVIQFKNTGKSLVYIATKHKNWIKAQEVISQAIKEMSPQVVLIEGIHQDWGQSPQNWEQLSKEDLHHEGSEMLFTYNEARRLQIPFVGSEPGAPIEFSSKTRDIYAIRMIARLMGRYKNVMVVYGAGHYVQQETALKEMFGQPKVLR